MEPPNPALRLRRPSFTQARDDRHLLVWGDLGQWLVVDHELDAFLACCYEGATIAAAVSAHARRWGKPPAEVQAETASILADLARRSIVDDGPLPPRKPEPLRISNLTYNITNRCNLRCRFCYNRDRHTDELPVAIIMDAIAAAPEIFARDASFIVLGGEPFLVFSRLLEAVDRAAPLFPSPCLVSTNGTLLEEGMAKELASRRVEVQVSIDSPTPAQHDALRGPGTFAKATRSARCLAEAGVRTIVSSVLGLDAVDNLEAMLDLALELGVAEARFIPWRQVGTAEPMATPGRPHLGEVLAHLMGLLARRPELRPLLGRDFFSILARVCRHAHGRTNCGIGRKVIFVDADGTVYPCPNHLLPEYRCGNLARDRLPDLVREAPPMVLARRRYQVDEFPGCRGCAFRYWCAGDCRGEALAQTGDPLAPSPYCADLQQCLIEMFWLLSSPA